MNRFQVIQGTPKRKPDYFSIYSRIFIKYLKEAARVIESGDDRDRELLKKVVFSGIKMINSSSKNSKDCDLLTNKFQIISNIKYFIGLLTSKEFETIFPISKEYDGERFESKDYFYTKNYIKEFGENRLIGDGASEFLWEYLNKDTKMFVVNTMCTMSAIRRAEGQKGLMEEFCDEHGITTYTMHETEKGKKFLVNNSTGETMVVKKPLPRYLKVIPDARYPN